MLSRSLILLVWLSGCAVTVPRHYQSAYSWTNANYESLLAVNGVPDAVYEDGHGGRALVFRSPLKPLDDQEVSISSNEVERFQKVVWDRNLRGLVPFREAQRSDIIYVDQEGVVYSVQSNLGAKVVRESQETNAIIGGMVGVVVLVLLLVPLF